MSQILFASIVDFVVSTDVVLVQYPQHLTNTVLGRGLFITRCLEVFPWGAWVCQE